MYWCIAFCLFVFFWLQKLNAPDYSTTDASWIEIMLEIEHVFFRGLCVHVWNPVCACVSVRAWVSVRVCVAWRIFVCCFAVLSQCLHIVWICLVVLLSTWSFVFGLLSLCSSALASCSRHWNWSLNVRMVIEERDEIPKSWRCTDGGINWIEAGDSTDVTCVCVGAHAFAKPSVCVCVCVCVRVSVCAHACMCAWFTNAIVPSVAGDFTPADLQLLCSTTTSPW